MCEVKRDQSEGVAAIGASASRGFTLVEALVAVGVVAVGMAIMVSVAVEVGEMRERTGCANNQRNAGISIWTFSLDHRGALPAHHREEDATFDTTMMRTGEFDYVNLGQVLGYVSQLQTVYCPSHDESSSPELAYRGNGNGNGHGNGHGKGKGNGRTGKAKKDLPDQASDVAVANRNKFNVPAGTNSSFAARPRLAMDVRQPDWAIRNYGNKVIYSDFLGVDGWQPKGRWSGVIRAPHGSAGYNRLFGDGAVNWTAAEPLNELRPIDEEEPTAEQFNLYYELLDVLP